MKTLMIAQILNFVIYEFSIEKKLSKVNRTFLQYTMHHCLNPHAPRVAKMYILLMLEILRVISVTSTLL